MLPDEVAGQVAVELGCGTGYVSAWLARRGAQPIGVDNSSRQLATARAMQVEFGIDFPLLHADAERGAIARWLRRPGHQRVRAAIWCDPYRWIPEAARLLRPGGRLVFMGGATHLMLCLPQAGLADDRVVHDLFGLHRLDDGGGVEFYLPHGERIRLLRVCGFEIDDLVEVQAPAGGVNEFISEISLDWARRWPSEEVWFARRQ